jgi:hypothetical protein
MFGVRGDSPSHAAGNILHVAGLPEDVSGEYFDEARVATPNREALETRTQERLVAATAAMLRAGGVPGPDDATDEHAPRP